MGRIWAIETVYNNDRIQFSPSIMITEIQKEATQNKEVWGNKSIYFMGRQERLAPALAEIEGRVGGKK